MAKAPAFQFYANDFMDATRFMEANAVGLYVRCLCIQWTQGGLPSDARTLSKGVGMDFEEFERAWKSVASKFVRSDDGLLRNSRLEAVRSRQEEVSSKRSDAGKAGAIAKANAKANEPTKDKQRKVKVKEKVNTEEEGETEKDRAKQVEELPFASPDFTAAWDGFVAMRQGKKKPMTDRARKLILNDLTKMGESSAILSLNASTRAGWTDVYAPKINSNGPATQTEEQRREERNRIIAERYAGQ